MICTPPGRQFPPTGKLALQYFLSSRLAPPNSKFLGPPLNGLYGPTCSSLLTHGLLFESRTFDNYDVIYPNLRVTLTLITRNYGQGNVTGKFRTLDMDENEIFGPDFGMND